MKKITKKIKFYLFLLLIVACNNNVDVDIIEFNTTVTYTSAIGYYWGDYFGTGTANFQLWLYSDTNEEIGVLIDGYATLPNSAANFRLDAGTYIVTDSEDIKTVYPSDEDVFATYAFNERTKQEIVITGGSFSVMISNASGNDYNSQRYDIQQPVYTIETNFIGRDVGSRAATTNEIRIKFEGQIVFDDMTLTFADIKQSTYSATGVQTTNRTTSWTGEIFPNDDDTGMYYAISNWPNISSLNLDYPYLCLDYVDGKLILDDYTKVGEDGDYDLYFGANSFSGSSWEEVLEYTVSYNKNTRILDFSGNQNGHQVYVGIWGEHYLTGEWVVYTNTKLKNVKFELTPSIKSSSSGLTNNKRTASTRSVNSNRNRYVENEINQKVKRDILRLRR